MSDVRDSRFRWSSIPKNRHFWMSFLLFCLVVFTAVLLIIDWNDTSRVTVFRRVIQIFLFSVWGYDRFRKYQSDTSGD